MKLEQFLDASEAAVIQHDARGVLLDPFNQLDSSRFSDETETEYIERAIRSMMRFARQLRVAFICVVHPSKAASEIRNIKNLSLYHCSGSAHWANKPQAGLVLWREPESQEINIKVAKNRYPESGRQWHKAALQLEPSSGRYSDVDLDDGGR
jgi:twinkle protein